MKDMSLLSPRGGAEEGGADDLMDAVLMDSPTAQEPPSAFRLVLTLAMF